LRETLSTKPSKRQTEIASGNGFSRVIVRYHFSVCDKDSTLTAGNSLLAELTDFRWPR
jgi:hypothetical protein